MNRGFTLLEALVAFAVLAVVLGMAMQAFSGGLRNTGAASDHARAVAHAQNRLSVVAASRRLPPGRSSGRFEDGQRWTLDVKPREPDTRAAVPAAHRVMDVRVTIDWGDTADPRRITLWTAALVPADDR